MTWAQGLTVAGLFVAPSGAAVAAQFIIITQAQAKALESTVYFEDEPGHLDATRRLTEAIEITKRQARANTERLSKRKAPPKRG